MAINSIHTDPGAMQGLQSLNRSNRSLFETQNRISTGSRIYSPAVDGAAFAVAAGLDSQIAALGAVNQQLGMAQGANGVAMAAAGAMSDTMIQAREVMTKLADQSLSTEQRAHYSADLQRLQGEVANFANNATFNGTNLITGNSNPSAVANADGGQVALSSQNIRPTDISAAFGSGGTVSAQDAAAALKSNSAFSQFADRMGSALNAFGGDARRIENQIKFNMAQQAATQQGVGAIRDADLARESVNLAKDQVRQQLSAISLGITNRSRESVIGMFLNR
ncbi:MAG TPA: flagellin [Azospirillaceae bacterium]|nr:flagellin [Azospirillaceae bacterium]